MHVTNYLYFDGRCEEAINYYKATFGAEVGMMLRLGQITIAQQNGAVMEHIEQLPREPGERWTRQRALAGLTKAR